MKFFALFVAVGCAAPLALWLRGRRYGAEHFWILFGLLPFLLPALPQLDVALVSWWPNWIGLLSAAEISVIDIIALGAYLSLPKRRLGISVHGPLLLYLLAIGVSATHALQPVAAMFYVFQFCRIYLLIVVVANASQDEAILIKLLQGMAIGICLEAGLVVWQRFGLHVIQTTGTFYHQNTLGLVTHLVVFPHLALLMAGSRKIQTIAAPLAGAVVAVLTTSRAALLFVGFGFVFLYMVSVARRWTGRKAMIGGACLVIAAAMAPLVISSFESRFEANPLMEEEYDERAAFNRTAALILQDYPFGVGVNHYVHIAKHDGYSERGGVAPVEGSRNNIVHNVYWLTASETGYPGLAAFLLMLATPMILAFRNGWRARGQIKGDLLIGFGSALLTVYLHSTLEYILLIKESQYLFAITAGCVFGLSAQLAKERAASITTAARAPIVVRSRFGRRLKPTAAA